MRGGRRCRGLAHGPSLSRIGVYHFPFRRRPASLTLGLLPRSSLGPAESSFVALAGDRVRSFVGLSAATCSAPDRRFSRRALGILLRRTMYFRAFASGVPFSLPAGLQGCSSLAPKRPDTNIATCQQMAKQPSSSDSHRLPISLAPGRQAFPFLLRCRGYSHRIANVVTRSVVV